jgi:hypothetical protein
MSAPILSYLLHVVEFGKETTKKVLTTANTTGIIVHVSKIKSDWQAGVAQLVEQLIRNEQVQEFESPHRLFLLPQRYNLFQIIRFMFFFPMELRVTIYTKHITFSNLVK